MSFHLESKKNDHRTGKPIVWSGPIRLMTALTQALLNAGALDDGTGNHPPLVPNAIDARKLASMDGQHVSPAECSAAASALRSLLSNEDEVDFLMDCLDLTRAEMKSFAEQVEIFTRFHEHAAALGGYTVS